MAGTCSRPLFLMIVDFLDRVLKLSLHPRKVYIETWASGVDFLGWICFPDHRVLRTATKRRALKRVVADPNLPRVASYLGMLKHGNAKGIERKIREIVEDSKNLDWSVFYRLEDISRQCYTL